MVPLWGYKYSLKRSVASVLQTVHSSWQQSWATHDKCHQNCVCHGQCTYSFGIEYKNTKWFIWLTTTVTYSSVRCTGFYVTQISTFTVIKLMRTNSLQLWNSPQVQPPILPVCKYQINFRHKRGPPADNISQTTSSSSSLLHL